MCDQIRFTSSLHSQLKMSLYSPALVHRDLSTLLAFYTHCWCSIEEDIVREYDQCFGGQTTASSTPASGTSENETK